MRSAPRKGTIAAAVLVMLAGLCAAQDEPAAPAPAPAAPAAAPPIFAPGPTAENNVASNEITPALDAAVVKGMAALVKLQAENGSFGSSAMGHNVAVTALACLALMADGNIPGRGGYGENVEKGLNAILENCTETGLIAAETSHGPMYGHGFATLFLGEIYGMTQGGDETPQSQKVHEALVKAVRLIVQTQNDEGGWRYNPVPNDADVSVTICLIMALRSARNAGLEVPKSTIDRAVEYVRLCQNTDGGFRYQAGRGGSAWPRSAAGVASLFYAGIYKDQAIDRGVAYLMETSFPGGGQANGPHYFYGHYYAVQAMYLAGGDNWAKWWPAVRDELISRQDDGGLWADNTAGEPYGTAMALIILQMPKRYLPIFQK